MRSLPYRDILAKTAPLSNNMAMELVRPSINYKDSYLAAIQEFRAEGKKMDVDIDGPDKQFGAHVEQLNGRAEGKYLKPGYVPESVFWLVDGGTFIGQIRIRHTLTDHLMRIGGHIGYSIRPSMRQQGYGTEILRLALPKAKELGISRALLTCDDCNIASQRIIEKNGGVLENTVPNPEGGPDKLRFWICT